MAGLPALLPLLPASPCSPIPAAGLASGWDGFGAMACSRASASWSKDNNLPFSPKRSNIAFECPPPPKVTSINSGTFYSCDFLEKVNIHDEVKYIANDAFDRCDKLTICGIKGSYAEQYANKHDIPFEELNNIDD